MKIGERGQVTIPKSIRNRFGLSPSTDVEFVEIRGELILRKKTVIAQKSKYRKTLESFIGITGGEPADIDEAIDEMRGR